MKLNKTNHINMHVRKYNIANCNKCKTLLNDLTLHTIVKPTIIFLFDDVNHFYRIHSLKFVFDNFYVISFYVEVSCPFALLELYVKNPSSTSGTIKRKKLRN